MNAAERIAKMLTDVAGTLPRNEFARLLKHVLEDTPPGDIALIAERLPVTLLPLLPRKFLH